MNAGGDPLNEDPAGSGRFTADVAEAISGVHYAVVKDGSGRSRRDGYLDDGGTIVKPDYPDAGSGGGGGTIEVLPLASQFEDPVVDTKITVYIGETRTIAVGVFDADWNPISLEGLGLTFTVTDKRKVVVATLTGGQIAVIGASHNTFTVTLPASVSEHLGRQLDWALRVAETLLLKAKGTIEVAWAPG